MHQRKGSHRKGWSGHATYTNDLKTFEADMKSEGKWTALLEMVKTRIHRLDELERI